jgi:hypothetical protein
MPGGFTVPRALRLAPEVQVEFGAHAATPLRRILRSRGSQSVFTAMGIV